MPRTLSEQEFNQVQEKVLASAPPGLDEVGFHRYMGPAMEQALGEAENTAAPSGLGDVVSGFVHTVNPIEGIRSMGHMLSEASKDTYDPAHPIRSAIDAVPVVGPIARAGRALAGMQMPQFQQAYGNFKQGQYSKAAGHAMAGVLPLVGPAAADSGEKLYEGDLTGLGEGLGQIANVVVGPRAPRAAEASVEAVQSGLRGGAERIIKSNLKAPPSLIERNPKINIPRVILDEGLKPGFEGVEQGKKLSAELGNKVTALADADAATGKTYPLGGVKRRLEDLRSKYGKNPAGEGDVASVQGVIDELMGNDRYAKDVTQTTMSPVQSAILGPNGQPLTTMKPTTTVVGRDLIPQDASSINTMKRAIYEENPKAYGERKGARIQAEKAMGSELKGILDQNVAGVQDINARNAGIITARKALNKMGVREGNKYPLGLMDLAAAGATAAGVGAGAGPLAAAPLLAAVLKHPTSAWPVARGLDKLGSATTPALAAKTVAGAAAAGNLVRNAQRPVSRSEVDRVKALLAAAQD